MNAKALTGKLDRRLFNQTQFKKADRVTRIYMAMVSPKGNYSLNKAEADYMDYLIQVYNILFDAPTYKEAKQMAIRIIPDRYKTEWRGAQAVRDAEALFGRLEDVDKRIQRGVVRERIQRRMHILENLPDEEITHEQREKVMAKYIDQLIKLDSLDKPDEAAEINTTIPDLQITDDPADLHAEDVDYEEVAEAISKS